MVLCILIEYEWFLNIWHVDGTLTGSIILGLSGTGSNGNEEVLHDLQSSRTGTWPLYIV